MIPWAKPYLRQKEKNNLIGAIDSGWISGTGPLLKKFEEYFQKEFNCKYSMAVCNGTAALQLAYLGLKLQREDEILVPGFMFQAGSNIALQLGISPIFCDVKASTWCLDPNDVEKKITNKSKVILAVHTYGNMCDMDDLKVLAKKHNLVLLEDTAEAIFSTYKNKYAGTIGDLGTFSFHAAKTITTGEGGLVVTNNEELGELMLLFRNQGMKKGEYYYHHVPGHNFRMTNLQAAIGVAQLSSIDEIKKKRVHLSELYKKFLDSESLKLQETEEYVCPIPWALAVYLEPAAFPQGRDMVIHELRGKGIETRNGFYSSDLIKIYPEHSVPISNRLGQQVICLPFYPTITDYEVKYICESLLNLKK